MNKYLLDTNIVSELRKARPHGGVVAWLNAQPNEHLLLSAVTIGELQAGIERARHQDPSKANEFEAWLFGLPELYRCLPLDVACFREWARLMYGKSGILSEDAMIAATARVHGLVVVTRNERDFAHFDVRILNPFKN